MRKCLLLALTMLTGCSSFEPRDDWSAKDQKRMWAGYAAIAADAITTERIDHGTGVKEGGDLAGRVLGKYPEPLETAAYMAAVAYGYRAIARRLPPKWRRVLQYWTIADHVYGTNQNCDLGLC